MTPIYPASLPSYVDRSSYAEQPNWAVVSFETEIGDPIERPASSFVMDDLACQISLSNAQLSIFRDFVLHELKRGTQPFLGPHPRTRKQVLLKFKDKPAPYNIRARTGIKYNVSFKLIVLGDD